MTLRPLRIHLELLLVLLGPPGLHSGLTLREHALLGRQEQGLRRVQEHLREEDEEGEGEEEGDERGEDEEEERGEEEEESPIPRTPWPSRLSAGWRRS